jgi:hypothetical protein
MLCDIANNERDTGIKSFETLHDYLGTASEMHRFSQLFPWTVDMLREFLVHETQLHARSSTNAQWDVVEEVLPDD